MVTVSKHWHSLRGWRAWCAALLLAPTLSIGQPAHDSLLLTVRPGDTLIGIGQRYLEQPGRWRELQRLNRIASERRLQPGSQLRVPTDWLRWTQLSAEVVHVQGAVAGARGPLAIGMRLGAGDSVDTGTQGALSLRFPDGGLAVFAPGTRAVLGVLREAAPAGVRATTIELQRGSVETTATPLQQPGSRFDVRTPRVVTAVRGTRFRVAVEQDVSRHEVLEGLVALAGAAPAPVAVAQGEGVRADAGRLGPVQRLLGAPDVTALPRRVERTAQALQVPVQPGAVGWRWQVAADGAFTQLLQDVSTRVPVWVWTGLLDGTYHMRVRAADGQGLEGRDAALMLVLAARPEPPLQITPQPGASVTAGASLVWAEVASASGYHLQLARDAAVTETVLDRAGLTQSRHTLDSALPPGRYHWRVATMRSDGTRGPFGDVAAFTLLEPSAVMPPQVGAGGLRLAWSGPAGFSHQVQVARDAAFADLELDQVVAGASLDLPAPRPGGYHVRTRLVLPDGSYGPWSQPQRFDIAPPPPPPSHPWGLMLLFLLPLLLP